MEESKQVNKDMIKWNELDALIGKPVFDKDNDEWRILDGYKRINDWYYVHFNDSVFDYEDFDLDNSNLFISKEAAYQK